MYISTHKSNAEIEGGSAINSNSAGGSLGTNCCSATCFSNSCCFCWAELVTDNCLIPVKTLGAVASN